MSLFGESKHAREGIAALFDIGNGSVAGALVYYTPSYKPEILYSVRKVMSFSQIPEAKKLTKTMLSTFLDIALALQAKGFQKIPLHIKKHAIDDVMCTFASPWSVIEARRLELSKQDEEIEVSEKMASEALKKEENKLLKDFAQNETLGVSAKPRLIESKIWQGTVSGYTTKNPIGKSGKNVFLDTVLGVMPEGIYEQTEKIIKQLTGNGRFHAHTFGLLSLSTFYGIFSDIKNFIFVNITAEITDVNFVQQGALTHNASFPKGGHYILRKLSHELKTPPEETPGLLTNFINNTDSTEQHARVEAVLNSVQKEWIKSFSEAIERVSPQTILPNTLFLTVDDVYAKWFEQIFKEENFGEYIFSKGSFDIKTVDSGLIKKYVTFTDLKEFDVFIGLESLFFAQEAHSKKS